MLRADLFEQVLLLHEVVVAVVRPLYLSVKQSPQRIEYLRY